MELRDLKNNWDKNWCGSYWLFSLMWLVLMLCTSWACKYAVGCHMNSTWRTWATSFWFSAVWGSIQAKMECLTPPTLTPEHWVIPSAGWPVLDDREERQPGNLPVRFRHGRDYFSSAQSNSVAWNWELCDLFFFCPCVLFCSPPPPPIHPSHTRFTPSSSAWYLGHEGTVFFRRKGRELTVHLVPGPRYVIENIQMD